MSVTTAPAARRVRIPLTPWLLILPSLVLALLIIGYPSYEIVLLSLSDVSRFGLIRGFVGLANFATVFTDSIFIGALWRTFEWTADNADYGMVNATLRELGLMTGSVQWMARAETAFPAEIVVGIVVSIPFTATILLGGLSSIPGDIYEAAAIDGARPWHSFRHLTLPLLGPFINIAVVLNVIHVVNSFPIIYVMTQGGPNNSTHILVTYLYELSFRLGRPGQASAVSLAMLAIVLCFTIVYMRLRSRDAA